MSHVVYYHDKLNACIAPKIERKLEQTHQINLQFDHDCSHIVQLALRYIPLNITNFYQFIRNWGHIFVIST